MNGTLESLLISSNFVLLVAYSGWVGIYMALKTKHGMEMHSH